MRSLGGGTRLLDRLEEWFAEVRAERIAEQLAEQVYVLAQRLVRISLS
jgi:hypothetical protein